ncbi:unnamed protein product [Schistosoma margrebowiei]|uniref:Uncharacterized protein n=1 Tax=Schistosoma margrebowiei TaxID=48269 RepID=A0A183MCT6_9TREM|nr:unnamed protein product [Schistosoma margrebowiei]
MKTSTSDGKHVIQWTSRMQLDDLDFAGDLSLLSQTQNADVKARIDKARAAYIQLKYIWNRKQQSINTKVRIFNTNVKTIILYRVETWRTTKVIIQKIQVLINSCLREILRIRWPDTVSNNLLWERKNQISEGEEIKKKRWKCIRHTMRKTLNCVTWNPQVYEKRGKPKNI